MSFKLAVCDALGEDSLHKGLSALKSGDTRHVSCARPRDLAGSADVDSALRATLPDAHRWDYVVGVKAGKSTVAHWIEVHPASGQANISEVERKLEWLAGWLRGKTLAQYPKDIVWIASGKSSFNSRTPRIKALAAKGCRFVGGHLEL